MTAVVLDAGALVAVDERDRRLAAMLRIAHAEHLPVRTSAAVVAQVWRDGSRQANLARVLAGVDVRALDPASGRQAGELLALTGAADVVDAHVALIAEAGDQILTSDADDLGSLLAARGVTARLVTV